LHCYYWQVPVIPLRALVLLLVAKGELAVPIRTLFPLVSKPGSILVLLALLAAFMLPETALGQGLEVGGGWSHVTGDFGTDGFNVGGAWWFTKRVTMAADYDSTWDTSSLTNFAFSQVGAIATKSHLQSFVVGPRVFFSTTWTDKHKLNPFGEAQFGVSHLSQDVTQVGLPTLSASDTAFTWMLGGGVDYLLTSRWSARANLDFLRTHFSNEGQSRLRLVLGIRYTFGNRERKIAAAPSPARSERTAQASNSATLIDLEHRWADALQKSDTATLESILDDTYVDTDEMGHRTDKMGLIATIRSGDLKINSIKLSGIQVYESGTTAVVTGRALQDGSYKGQPLTESVVFTDTFMMRQGSWRAVSSHRSTSHD
jgi:opacity protein-like surface antigen/ketosteroid isomerase-like protein